MLLRPRLKICFIGINSRLGYYNGSYTPQGWGIVFFCFVRTNLPIWKYSRKLCIESYHTTCHFGDHPFVVATWIGWYSIIERPQTNAFVKICFWCSLQVSLVKKRALGPACRVSTPQGLGMIRNTPPPVFFRKIFGDGGRRVQWSDIR